MGASNDPVYLRVLEDLRDQIRGGALAPGARVPSRNGIIARYGVGETAAKHALQVLAAEGLIEARAGSGSYVRRLPVAAALEHDRLHFPGSPFGLDGGDPARGGTARCHPRRARPAADLGVPVRAGAGARARGPAAPASRRGSSGNPHPVPDDRGRLPRAAGHELRARRDDRADPGAPARAGHLRGPRRGGAHAGDRHRRGPGRGGDLGPPGPVGRGRGAEHPGGLRRAAHREVTPLGRADRGNGRDRHRRRPLPAPVPLPGRGAGRPLPRRRSPGRTRPGRTRPARSRPARSRPSRSRPGRGCPGQGWPARAGPGGAGRRGAGA